VEVIRDGERQIMSITKLELGDIYFVTSELKTVPVNSVILGGNGLKLKEVITEGGHSVELTRNKGSQDVFLLRNSEVISVGD
jgi:magnesium-transporting ATPase (P-type)